MEAIAQIEAMGVTEIMHELVHTYAQHAEEHICGEHSEIVAALERRLDDLSIARIRHGANCEVARYPAHARAYPCGGERTGCTWQIP